MGSDRSFDEVYDQLFPAIYRFIAARVPGSDVEDVTAEVMAKAWRAWPEFQGNSSPKTWALRIAYNQIADYYRKKKHWPVIMSLEPDNVTMPDPSEQASILLSIGQALAHLNQQQVAVIQLRLVEGFSAAEAAAVLGISPSAVDSLLYRAKKSFRELYQGTKGGGLRA